MDVLKATPETMRDIYKLLDNEFKSLNETGHTREDLYSEYENIRDMVGNMEIEITQAQIVGEKAEFDAINETYSIALELAATAIRTAAIARMEILENAELNKYDSCEE